MRTSRLVIGPVLMVALVLGGRALAQGGGAAKGPSAEVRAISVLDPKLEAVFGDEHLMMGDPGITLGFLVRSPEQGIVAIDRRGSKMTALSDDKGGDLTKALPRTPLGGDDAQGGGMMMMGSSGFSPFPKFSADRKALFVSYSAPGAPAAGATKVTLKGTLKLDVASGEETVDVKDVALKPGPINAPGHAISIERVGEPEMSFGEDGGEEFAVQLQTQGQTTRMLGGVEFLDAAGKPIESRQTSSMQMGDTRSVAYTLGQKLEKATIRLKMWKEVKSVVVPLDAEVTLGVAAK